MCAKSITSFDRTRKSRADDWSTDGGVRSSPLERMGLDAMLIGIRYENVVSLTSYKWASAGVVRVITRKTG